MILTTLLALATLHGVQAQSQTRSGTSTATAEGAEILRHILSDALEDAFTPRKEGERLSVHDYGNGFGGLVTTLWASDQTVQHSRVFHLPEVGLFFAFDASLPVVKKKAPAAPGGSDQPTDDEWEKARKELRGDPFEGARRWRVGVPVEASEIDPQALDKTVDLVLRTCARHAARVEGLAPQETITIALRLSGRSHAWVNDADGRSVRRLMTLSGEADPEGSGGKGEGEDEAAQTFAYALASGPEVREQNLVIRVALADLAGAGEGNLERLRQRALINRY